MVYRSKFASKETDEFFRAVLALENNEECYRFFEDIMTVNEIKAISQRWHVAVLLSKGKTYAEIEAATKASTATISRINKCLSYGADGYAVALDRLDKDSYDF